MRIKLKQSVCGGIEGRPGQVIDAPDDEAERLIAAGIAEGYEDLQARVADLESQLAAAKAELAAATDEPKAKKKAEAK